MLSMTNHFSSEDHFMMEEAFLEAEKAFDKEEVPVGAVLSFEGKIIARSHNQMETRGDPTAHAEILCIREGAEVMGNWRLLGSVLYTTLEPCVMCAGALLLARVHKVIWAAPDKRHGAHGSFVDLFDKKHPTHKLEIEGGLFESRSAHLMRHFFKKRRIKHEKDRS